MKAQIALLLVGILFTATYVEGLNIHSLLQDRDMVERQIACILEQGHCDHIGKYLKHMIPEYLLNDCRRCTEGTKMNANAMASFIESNYPEEWGNILYKYGIYEY